MTRLSIRLISLLLAAAAAGEEAPPLPPALDELMVHPYGDREEILSPANAINQRAPFEAEKMYPVLTLPLVPTQIVLHPQEVFVGLYMGDTNRWVHNVAGSSVFFKPIKHGISTVAQLKTSRRTYSLLLIAGEAGDPFYYRMAWDYPDMVAEEAAAAQEAIIQARVQAAIAEALQVREQKAQTAARHDDFIAALYMDYEFSGDIRPLLMMDDGIKTYIKLATADLPAIYVLEHGETLLPNFNLRGGFVVVDRVASVWQFVLGERRGTARRRQPLNEDKGQPVVRRGTAVTGGQR